MTNWLELVAGASVDHRPAAKSCLLVARLWRHLFALSYPTPSVRSMSELTTSRINRQFRTLRNKCSALNSFTPAPSRPKVSVTYGRSSRGHAYQSHEDDETPPLAILQSLDKLGSRLHLDRAIVENMQLSKRIYEVRDAFKNIVQAAFGATSEELHRLSPVESLTSICARVIGEHVQSEMDASLEDVPDVDGEEDSVRSKAMDDIYESVPAQHRQ